MFKQPEIRRRLLRFPHVSPIAQSPLYIVGFQLPPSLLMPTASLHAARRMNHSYGLDGH